MSRAATSSDAAKRSRRRTVLLSGGLGVVVVGLIVGVVFLQRQHERNEGIRLALAGELTQAEPLLVLSLERDPNDVEVLRALTLGRLSAGKLEPAEEPLAHWRALRPTEAEPHLAAVDLAVRRGDLPAAIQAAGQVLELQPDIDDLRQRRTVWLVLTGNTEEAETECRRLRERRPDDPALSLLEAEICLRLGEASRAEPLVDGLLRTEPRLAPALVLRGALHLEAGQSERAIAPLRQALSQPGEHRKRARHFLSLALARTGQEAEARRLLAEEQQQQAVDLWEKYGRSESVGYKVSIAEALMANGKTDEAARLLERAIAQSPECLAAHRMLADVYDRQGKSEKAAQHRKKAGG